MGLNNYRDLSTGGTDVRAGFQFEFSCQCCNRTWRSEFKPYRTGQISGLLTRFAFLLSGRASMANRVGGSLADLGTRRAYENALADAMAHADTLYKVCRSCEHAVCEKCWHDDEGWCNDCVEREHAVAGTASNAGGAAGHAASGPACPNCRTTVGGGRFCPECGFDMASTHKTCPQCGVMQLRQARFCTDCGHGF